MLRRLREDDRGVTLIELMVYALLLSSVILIIGGVAATSSISERTVRSVVTASTEAQLAVDAIETGIRNSSNFTLTNPTTSSQFVTARVARGTTTVTYICAAWYYSSTLNNGSIHYKESTTAIAVPTTAQAATWKLIVDDVKPSTGTTIFGGTDQLTIAFKVLADGHPPASVSSSATSRSENGASAPCF